MKFLHDGGVIASFSQLIPSLNLLGHAQLEEVFVGSQCGGHGICGGDRLKISLTDQTAYFNPPTEAERSHLSAAQLSEGFRLACQCFPNTKQPEKEFFVEVLSIQS